MEAKLEEKVVSVTPVRRGRLGYSPMDLEITYDSGRVEKRETGNLDVRALAWNQKYAIAAVTNWDNGDRLVGPGYQDCAEEAWHMAMFDLKTGDDYYMPIGKKFSEVKEEDRRAMSQLPVKPIYRGRVEENGKSRIRVPAEATMILEDGDELRLDIDSPIMIGEYLYSPHVGWVKSFRNEGTERFNLRYKIQKDNGEAQYSLQKA